PGFPHAGAGAVDGGLLPKRRVDRAIVDKLLDLVQRRLTPRAVEVARLLIEQRIDVGITAVDVGAALRHESFKTRGGVAEQAALALDEILERLLRVALEEGCPLERPQLAANAYFLE